jgi:hypothetical protein
MSEELNDMLNKIDYKLQERGLLNNNWNLTLNSNNPYKEINEKIKYDMKNNTFNNYYPKTTTSFYKNPNLISLDKNNFTYNGNPKDNFTDMVIKQYEIKKIIETEINSYLEKAKKEIKTENELFENEIKINQENQNNINNIYNSLLKYENNINKIENEVKILSNYQINYQSSFKNEFENIKKLSNESMKKTLELDNQILYIENKMKEVVYNQRNMMQSINDNNKVLAKELKNQIDLFKNEINNSMKKNNNNLNDTYKNFIDENDKQFQLYYNKIDDIKKNTDNIELNEKNNEPLDNDALEKLSENFNNINLRFQNIENQNNLFENNLNEINKKIVNYDINDNELKNKYEKLNEINKNLFQKVENNEKIINDLNTKILNLQNNNNNFNLNINEVNSKYESINKIDDIKKKY